MPENSAALTRQTPEPSFYERVGGAEGLRDLVDAFYRRVLGDDQLRPYFSDTDMTRLKRHQAALLATVLGGLDGYSGRDLGTAHAHLGVTDAAYRRVGDHLVAVLDERRAGDDLIAHVVRALVSVSDQIVTKPADHNASRWMPSWAGPTPPAGIESPA